MVREYEGGTRVVRVLVPQAPGLPGDRVVPALPVRVALLAAAAGSVRRDVLLPDGGPARGGTDKQAVGDSGVVEVSHSIRARQGGRKPR